MNFSSVMSLISNVTMKCSSAFSAGSNSFVSASLSVNANTVVLNFLDWLAKFIYFICKWMLYALDIVFAYVSELSGLNMSFDSFDSLVSSESDIVFNLLSSGKETIVPIIKNLIGLAVVLIIIFSIVALIKGQLNSLEKNDTKFTQKVFTKMCKSLVLLLIIPMMAIVGIIASDLILQALYNATNQSGAVSLGSQVFSTSAMSANAYRNYGVTGKKIPITYDFTKEKEILEYYKDKSINDTFTKYLTSSSNLAYTTYVMFQNEDFQTFDSMNVSLHNNTSTQNVYDNYYKSYDVSNDAISNDDDVLSKYKRIESYQAEYLVMADLIDYCVNTSCKVYFKTIEEVMNSMLTVDANILNSFVTLKSIKFVDENDAIINNDRTAAQIFESDDWEVIRYTSDYYSPDDSTEPAFKTQIQYNHVRRATDEREGAKFVIAVEKTTTLDGVSYTYFEPMMPGYTTSDKVRDFSSDFIAKGNIVSAKGIFYKSAYPTAIKISSDGTTVQFYREELTAITVGNAGDTAGFSLVAKSDTNFFGKIKKFFKALFNPASLLPEVNVNISSMNYTYDSEMITANTLSNGQLHISYMFADNFISDKIGSIYGLQIDNLYSPHKINYLLLVVATILLIKVTFKALFALISRAYDLFLIIVIYPAACASMPLDDGGWKEWVNIYMSRLFSTYGLLIGLNFVFLLFPIINKIEFFSVKEVGSSKIIQRVTSLFTIVLSVNHMTSIMNMIVALLFELTAFTMIEAVPGIISTIVGSGQNSSDPLQPVTQSLKMIANASKMIADVKGGLFGIAKTALDPKYRKEKMDQLKEKATSFMPGSAIVKEAKDQAYLRKKAKDQKDEERKLIDMLKNGENKGNVKAIQAQFDKVNKAQESYTKALSNPTKGRKAESDQKKEDKKTGTTSRDDFDDELNDVDYNDLTGRQLRRQRRKAKKFKRRLERLQKHGGLTDDQAEALNIYRRKLQNIKDEKKKRKEDKKEFKNIDKEKDKLLAQTKNGGMLSDEARAKYSELLDKEKEYYENKKGRKKRAKAQKKRIKGDKKTRVKQSKLQKKLAAKQQYEKELFTKRNLSFNVVKMIHRHKNKNRLVNKDETKKQKLLESLKNIGFEQDISKMKDEDINKLLADPEKNNISEDQAALIQEYMQTRNHLQGLVNLKKKQIEGRGQVKSAARRRKDVNIASATFRERYLGKLPRIFKVGAGKSIRRGVRGIHKTTALEKEQNIQNIDQRIKEIEDNNIDASNYKEYLALQQKRAKMQTKLDNQRSWEQMNTKEGRNSARDEKIKRKNSIKYETRLYNEAMERIKAEIAEQLEKAKTQAEKDKVDTQITSERIEEMKKRIQKERR